MGTGFLPVPFCIHSGIVESSDKGDLEWKWLAMTQKETCKNFLEGQGKVRVIIKGPPVLEHHPFPSALKETSGNPGLEQEFILTVLYFQIFILWYQLLPKLGISLQLLHFHTFFIALYELENEASCQEKKNRKYIRTQNKLQPILLFLLSFWQHKNLSSHGLLLFYSGRDIEWKAELKRQDEEVL